MSDIHTLMSYASAEYRKNLLAVKKNYPLDVVWNAWVTQLPDKRLKGTQMRGCGLNALAFLTEMSVTKAEGLVPYLGNLGTPFEDIVNWFNNKSIAGPIEKSLYFYKKTYNIVYPGEESNLDDVHVKTIIKDRILKAYNDIFNQMSNDSTTLIKYERNQAELTLHGVNLTPGHTAILGRQRDQLYTADPQQISPPKILKLDAISDNAYNAIVKTNFYRTFNLIGAANIDCAFLVDLVLNNDPHSKTAAEFLKKKRPDVFNVPAGFFGGASSEIDVTDYLKYMPMIQCTRDVKSTKTVRARKTTSQTRSRGSTHGTVSRLSGNKGKTI